MNYSTCLVCNSSRWRTRYTITFQPASEYKLVECLHCGLVCVSKLPSKEELVEYYRNYSYLNPKAWDTSHMNLRSLDILLNKLARFKKHNILLDVGCGAGGLLKRAKAKGWETIGVDISDAAISRLRDERLIVQQGDLCNLNFPDEEFDVITMTELIEHLRNPVLYIQESYRILRPGGALYLTTPNFNSLTRRLVGQKWQIICPPEHLFYFSLGCLSSLLRRCGFNLISACTENINPHKIAHAFRNEKTPDSYNRAAASTDMLRARIVSNPFLHVGKKLLNTCLTLTRSGDTLKVLAIKPLSSCVKEKNHDKLKREFH